MAGGDPRAEHGEPGVCRRRSGQGPAALRARRERATCPRTLLERSELERLLAAGIEDIPAIERTVLSLYYQEELTLREIAQVVNLHESRISQLKSQAILRLRGQLSAAMAGHERNGRGMISESQLPEIVHGLIDRWVDACRRAGVHGRPENRRTRWEACGRTAGRTGSVVVGTILPWRGGRSFWVATPRARRGTIRGLSH